MKFNEEIFNDLRIEFTNDFNRDTFFIIKKDFEKHGISLYVCERTKEVTNRLKSFLMDVSAAKGVTFYYRCCETYGRFTNEHLNERFQYKPGVAFIECVDLDKRDFHNIDALNNSFVTMIISAQF